MLCMIADWHQSGKCKKDYCAENEINEATFYFWFSRCEENDIARVNFITIDKAQGKDDVEIFYPSSVPIKVENYFALVFSAYSAPYYTTILHQSTPVIPLQNTPFGVNF